jgi:hypothetical protein
MLPRIYTSTSTGRRTVIRYKGIFKVVVVDSLGIVYFKTWGGLYKDMGLTNF